MKHKKRAMGGKTEKDLKGKTVEMNAQGSEVMKDSKSTSDDFKRGGHVKRKDGGKVEGKAVEERMDRRARGGMVGSRSALSSAHALKDREGGKDTGHEGSLC